MMPSHGGHTAFPIVWIDSEDFVCQIQNPPSHKAATGPDFHSSAPSCQTTSSKLNERPSLSDFKRIVTGATLKPGPGYPVQQNHEFSACEHFRPGIGQSQRKNFMLLYTGMYISLGEFLKLARSCRIKLRKIQTCLKSLVFHYADCRVFQSGTLS